MKRFILYTGLLLAAAATAVNAQTEQAKDANKFALDFFEKIIETRHDSSVITSPLGVNFVLGMLDNGANGQTAQEINQAVGATSAADLADWHHGLMASFPTLDDKTEFGIANAIILNSAKGYSFLPTYTQQMQTEYEALIRSMDFGETSTLDYINNWGAEKTKGMIPKVLTQLNPDAVSVLMNALYFKGIWSKTFNPDETRCDYFYTNAGITEEVAMMHASGSYPYAENDIFKTVRLDYGNGSYSMYVMLPQGNHTISDIITKMNNTTWQKAPVMTDDVHLSLPQFSSESDLRLTDILKALGMTTMFNPGHADFSGMMDLSSVEGNLYVSMFKQVARIEVDENGTKAAAVTIVGMGTTSLPDYTFYANRPFLYTIVENTTGTICFMGQFTGVGPDASARPFTDGIPQVRRGTCAGNMYDLSGRRLHKPEAKGIYIIDGKKKIY